MQSKHRDWVSPKHQIRPMRFPFLGVLLKLRKDPLGVLAHAASSSEDMIYLGALRAGCTCSIIQPL